ncbi:unnamed protein product, partial [marine sediment metagenome]
SGHFGLIEKCECSVDVLANKILEAANASRETLVTKQRNARHRAKKRYDWNKNSQTLVNIIRNSPTRIMVAGNMPHVMWEQALYLKGLGVINHPTESSMYSFIGG